MLALLIANIELDNIIKEHKINHFKRCSAPQKLNIKLLGRIQCASYKRKIGDLGFSFDSMSLPANIS